MRDAFPGAFAGAHMSTFTIRTQQYKGLTILSMMLLLLYSLSWRSCRCCCEASSCWSEFVQGVGKRAAGARVFLAALGKEPGSSQDQQILLAFKQAIREDPSGVVSTWQAELWHCSWYGIQCNLEGRVTAIRLSGHQLGGSLVSSLGRLPFLSTLSLSQNRFTGTVPPDLGGASALVELDLHHNFLWGPVPPKLGSLPLLQVLDLSFNLLSGAIPEHITRCTHLVSLLLDHNQLSGPIPDTFQTLHYLAELDLSSNSIQGGIPGSLESCSRLQFLSLSDNMLSGGIPPGLATCSNLQVLALARNQLTGSIPRELGRLGSLRWMMLQGNLLQGEIPEELSNCSSLEYLDMRYNSCLGGRWPNSLARVLNGSSLLGVGNKFVGGIPRGYDHVESLQFSHSNDSVASSSQGRSTLVSRR